MDKPPCICKRVTKVTKEGVCGLYSTRITFLDEPYPRAPKVVILVTSFRVHRVHPEIV